MKSGNVLKRSMMVAALVLSGMVVSQARANQVITFLFTSPHGSENSPGTYTDSLTGLTLTANAYNCGGLCVTNPSTNYSNKQVNLYDNWTGTDPATKGLGIANNSFSYQGVTRYAIPNTEFVQVDFSSIPAGNKIQSIGYTMTDISSGWSSFGSTVKGELMGGGFQYGNDSASGAPQSFPSPFYNYYSFVAGTNCDVVLNKIVVTLAPTQPTPEPATLLMTGLVLIGLGGIIKKTRKRS